ncbi:phage tail protein I [Methylopila sp. M107]|uniref:phage tail protein I n=1 Tax=Methylopila sp. M107 TaxID=1101190 RepID=UPI00035F38F3|nr:phage tail protein I [Methylopila sp. M107]
MIETLLPLNALSIEAALAEVNAGRRPLPAHLVATVNRPAVCPSDLLGYLAWARSVDVWDESWSDDKKRYVIAHAFRDHRLKGTRELIERYCGYVGAAVIDVIAPPQRFVLGRARTVEEIEAIHGRLPEVRIYSSIEPRAARGLFFGHFVRGAGQAYRASSAAGAHEVRAELRRGGTVSRLRLAEVTPSNLDDETALFERLFLPHANSASRVLGRLRRRAFWGDREPTQFVASFRRSVDGDADGGGSVGPGLYPAITRPDRVYPAAHAPRLKAFYGRRLGRFRTATQAAARSYDRLRLWDESAASRSPRRAAVWGRSRRGAAPLTAIVSIAMTTRSSARKRFIGGPLRGAMVAHDPVPFARVVDAIRAAKVPHERIFIDLADAFERRVYGARP